MPDPAKPAAAAPSPAPSPTPTPAPQPSPAPSPPPAPAAAPSKEPEGSADNAFDRQFDDLNPAAPKPAPAAPAPAAAPAKPAPGAPAAAPAKPADDLPAFKTNADLRKFAYEQKRRVAELEGEKTSMETKLRDIEATVPKTQSEREALAKKVQTYEKQLADYESEIQMRRYESSNEYKTKFLTPYNEAVASAIKDVEELLVTIPDPSGALDEYDKPKMIERQATRADFEEVYSMKNTGAAIKLAKQLFGDGANIVIQHRKAIIDKAVAANKAVLDHKENFKKIEQEELARTATETTQKNELWVKVNEDIANKRADLFKPGDDPEENAALEKGYQMADMLFNGQREQLPMAQRVVLDAQARHRVAAFPLLNKRLEKLKGQVEQLTKENEELRQSENPGQPRPTAVGAPAADNKSPTEKFEEMMG